MTTHRSESIITAIVTALTGLSTTGSRVYRGRQYEIESTELPCLLVYAGPDSDLAASPWKSLDADCEVIIEAVVKSSTTQVDTTLNTIRYEVEQAIYADTTFGLSYVHDTTQGAATPYLDGSTDKMVGRLRMEWTVLYRRIRIVPSGYPLNDDGTVAALYSFRAMPADAPDYTSCSVTFDATLTTRIASPTLAAISGTQALAIASGPWHAEMKLTTPPSGSPANFGNFELLCVPSIGGVLSQAGTKIINITNQSGTAKVSATGASDHAISSSLAGYRVSIDVATNGDITYQCTDGSVGTVAGALAAYDAVTFFLTLVPTATASGSTATFELIDRADSVLLPAITGAKSLDGTAI